MTESRRIAITTGGGDAPGLNAAIHRGRIRSPGLGANHLAARYVEDVEERSSKRQGMAAQDHVIRNLINSSYKGAADMCTREVVREPRGRG